VELYVKLKMEQNHYEVSIIITKSIFSDRIIVLINSSCTTHHENTVVFNKIKFLRGIIYDNHFIFIHFSVQNHHCVNKTISKHDKVIIRNCSFLNNLAYRNYIIYSEWLDIISEIKQNVIIENCFFAKNKVHNIIYSEWFHEVKIIGQNIRSY